MEHTIFKSRKQRIKIALSILLVLAFLVPGTSVFSGNSQLHLHSIAPILASSSGTGKYTVTFFERGLPNVGTDNAPWAVTFNNTTKRSDTNSIVFFVNSSRNYTFTIGNISGFIPSPKNGSIYVDNADYVQDIYFSTEYHTVTFYETGLPNATPWTLELRNGSKLAINKTSGNSSITFALLDGTYNYSIAPTAGYYTSHANGKVNVSNENVKVMISFTNRYNLLYFKETGLPVVNGSMPDWSVNLSGHEETSQNSSILFRVPNGTYHFSIPSVGGYVSELPAKTIYLNSSTYSEPVVFVPDKHYIKFIEKKGLPSGMSWGVNVTTSAGSIHQFSDNNTVVFTVNGSVSTISYSVLPNAGFSATANGSGSLSLSTTNTVEEVNVSFSQSTTASGVISSNSQKPYEIQFFEHGLPYGIQYSVTLNTSKGNFTESSENGGLVTFIGDTNGSYVAWFSSQDGFISVQRSMIVNVDSNYTVVNLTYVPETFVYSVNETGLPAGVDWTLYINGYTYSAGFGSATTGNIMTQLGNGTYYYFIDPVIYHGKRYLPLVRSGFFTINGKSTSFSVRFYQNYIETTFRETGLPAGSDWSIELDGLQYYSNGTGSFSLNLVNGTYFYMVPLFNGTFVSDNTGGVLSMNSSVVGYTNITLHFHSLTHNFTIMESGLPSGVYWEYDINGIIGFTDHSNTSVSVENGSVQAVIMPVNDSISGFTYYAIPPVYNILLNGNTKVGVTYNDFVYNVILSESNLPAGAIWYIYIDGTLYNSTVSNPVTITLELANGTYNYYIPHVDTNYWPSRGNGTITVDGENISKTIQFGINDYAARFLESGLSSSVEWNVTVYNNTASFYQTSYYSSIEFQLPNGTYEYKVRSLNSEYMPITNSGIVVIYGAPATESISFIPVQYNVTFIESGLPSGVTWTVNFAGTVYSNSTSSIVIPNNFNGTYKYSITNITGYTVAPSSGTVIVNGSNVVVHIYFSSTTSKVSPPPPPSKSSGFHLPGYALIVIIAVVIVGALIAGVVIMQQQKKNKPK